MNVRKSERAFEQEKHYSKTDWQPYYVVKKSSYGIGCLISEPSKQSINYITHVITS